METDQVLCSLGPRSLYIKEGVLQVQVNFLKEVRLTRKDAGSGAENAGVCMELEGSETPNVELFARWAKRD